MVANSPDAVDARDRVHDLLVELAELIGPAAASERAVWLEEWTLVAAWVDERGTSHLTRLMSAHLAPHRRSGLLHAGLHACWE